MIGINVVFSGFLFIETLIIILVGCYACKKKTVPGAWALFILCMASSFYSFGYGMELLSNNLTDINFWSKFQYIGLPFIPFACVLLSLTFTGVLKEPYRKWVWIAAVPGAITSLLRWTSEQHHLMYGKMTLVYNGYYSVLAFEKGIWYYLHFVYFLLCAGFSVYNYITVYKRSQQYMKKPILLMMTASLIPFVSIFVNLNNLFFLQMDSGPFFILLDYMIFMVGIFRYNIMHLIPLSRNSVFEWIDDGVLVLDLNENIIDMNRAVKEILNVKDIDKMIGLPAERILNDFKALNQMVRDWYVEHVYKFDLVKQDSHYEMLEWTHPSNCKIYGVRFRALTEHASGIGVIMMFSDITKPKEMVTFLERMAQIDDLTGIYNRRYFIELVEKQVDVHLKERQNGFVVVFDIDHFKRINDQYGHLAGDFVLKELAKWVSERLPENAIFGRYGGEEFVIFMPNTPEDKGVKLTEEIRQALGDYEFCWEENHIHITASFGCSALEAIGACSRLFEEMFARADEALYEAKNQGRNCTKIIKS